jgi:hypothetical protein
MNTFRYRIFAFGFAALFGADAHAAVFSVGTGAGCTHGTIQAAIDAANTSAGADTVRLTRSLTYEPEADTINTAQELTVEGGYATCDQSSADTTRTIVSGAGGVHAAVLTITAPTGALIHLRRLTLSGGDVDGTIVGGGGIRFVGDGVLDIADSFITQNRAGQGGGIYAEGTGSNAELVIGANVTISNNTATNGGGVMVEGLEMSMLDANSIILLNHAVADGGGGVGGGLLVRSGSRPSFAYIGSGAAAFGALYGNDASYGGGVAVESPSNNYTAQLQLFATDPARPAYVGSNTASVQGGGIHAFGSKASARLWDAAIDDNLAANGAAVYLAAASGLYVNFAALPAAAASCAVGVECGSISDNVANSDTSSDAIVYGEDGTTIQIGYLPTAAPADARGGVLIRNNEASTVFGGAATTQIYRTLISDNTTSSDLIKQSTNPLSVVDSTIAGNAIGGGSAILRTANSALTIQRSILWQPASTSLSRSGGSLTIDFTDASENDSLGGGFVASTFDPFFVDPAHGDYGLRAGSGAIDFAPATPVGDRDAYGQPRATDLLNADRYGPRDIGALERQSLQPIVLNGDFDYSDLRLWTKFDGAWDGTQNVVGGSGSGSWKYSIASTSVADAIVADQCIVLPAPATYLLDGWGKGGGGTIQSRDFAILKWEVRKQSDGGCTSGVVKSGQLTLGSGTSWGHPAQPAIIDLPEDEFGDKLSIRLILVAHDGGSTSPHALSAWFDGITLDVEPSDVIFEDGFE